ncbi:MAG TPA: tRNA (adenosine(37)-N6)-threonylcarbamoyltransferase complex ATPase subunit type 1 TsaE [Methylomirabilota bacterium]|jgi:tRNA threonylcarbamoyladenosine biosynthesis protein TsaE|nr:tRNA (adenosine(37)-N6)-threonylcarbamoyltransferase complex ATPase subunit type 1 TsaE [Methylomirabilota bacterium]
MIFRNLSLKKLESLGRTLGQKYANQKLVIGLVGPLGAGKTTLTKSLAQALGIASIKSPSFVVMHEYQLRKSKFYHLDFYRLKHVQETAIFGLEEILSGDNLVLIEWADRFPEILKKCNIIIQIQINEDQTRNVTIQNSKN